jgi:hypothetical protein
LLGKAPSPIKDVKNALSGATSLSGEALYSALNTMIGDPTRKNSSLDGKFTVTVYVSDKAEEVTFDEEPNVKHLYQAAWIARNDNDYFLLDVKDLDEPLAEGNYYSITGTTNGSVYWTEDSKKVDVLDVLVKEAKPFTPKEPELNEGSSILDAKGNQYTFLGAHKSKYILGDCVVVYFDFKNNGSTEATPGVRAFDFYQGSSEETSSSKSFDPEDADSKALNATKAGIVDSTYAGKTQRYFAVFAWQDAKEDGDTLYLVRYNDDFEQTDDIAIAIEKNLKAWQGKQ